MSASHNKKLIFLALSIALLAICSWITIPTIVPFTMQTFAIYVILALFGGRFGTTAIGLYLIMGFTIFPVFAGFKSGYSVLLGPTGGYLIGFFLMALFYWFFTNTFGDSVKIKTIALLIGLLIVYAFGTAFFMFVYLETPSSMGLLSVLSACVFPFIIPDVVKLSIAMLVTKRLQKTISLSN